MSKQILDLRVPDIHTSAISALPETAASLRLIDRLSLRLALWLLLRSTRRARRHANHEVHARLLANERERVVREAAALRRHLLSPRP